VGRDDVDALNTAARAAWAQLGRLSGPELETPGGRRYAAGDHVLMLAQGPDGAWVTSEHATVLRVDPTEMSLTAVTAAGRTVRLDRDATSGDRLAHGYALTVHRAQGVTCDTAHVLGSLDDAAGREWTRLAAFIDRQAFAETLGDGFRRVQRRTALEAEVDELGSGTGRHATTPAGHVAQTLTAIETALPHARRDAGNAAGPFGRRRARHQVAQLEADRDQAARHSEQLAGPELGRLPAALDQTRVSDPPRYQAREAWLDRHPDIRQHYRGLARAVSQAAPAPQADIQPSQDLELGL